MTSPTKMPKVERAALDLIRAFQEEGRDVAALVVGAIHYHEENDPGSPASLLVLINPDTTVESGRDLKTAVLEDVRTAIDKELIAPAIQFATRGNA